MSNIPVKRSFTASLRSASMLRYATHRSRYETIYNDLELIRGLFFCLYNIYIKNTNKMLAHFKNAPNSYLRNFLRNSKRIVHDEPLTLLY